MQTYVSTYVYTHARQLPAEAFRDALWAHEHKENTIAFYCMTLLIDTRAHT